MTTETYIATAYRWGELNGHHYLVAAGPDRDLVIQAATAEVHDRSGKYGVEVVSLTLTGEQKRVAYLPSRCDEPAPRHNHRAEARHLAHALLDAIGERDEAEAIVRDIADCGPIIQRGDHLDGIWRECALCGDDARDHTDDTCPYLRARAFVARDGREDTP